jgi:hypothetical protein
MNKPRTWRLEGLERARGEALLVGTGRCDVNVIELAPMLDLLEHLVKKDAPYFDAMDLAKAVLRDHGRLS